MTDIDASGNTNEPKRPYVPVQPESLNDINLLDSTLQNCPYHAYQKLRDEAPVWQDPVTGFYVVSRFEDVRAVLLNTKDYISDMSAEGQGASRSQLDQERAERMQRLYEQKGWVPGVTLAGRDDPNHREMRAMFNEAFRPKRIEAMDPFVRETAYKLIDGVFTTPQNTAQGSGPNWVACDWVQQFAVPLPLIVIGHQVGVPEADIWQIKKWTDAWVQRLGMMQTEDEERWSVEMEIEAQHYFQPIFERLRKTPDDSLLSEMVNRVIPEWGRPLNDNELHAEMMADTFVGGAETTTNAIGYGVKLLIDNPLAWQQLASDPEQYMRTFIEEVLRLEGPVQGLFRKTAKDVVLADSPIPAGSMVNVRYAAANLDEREFVEPAQLDLNRDKPGRHLAFGSGIHHCLGAPLARRELHWSFMALVEKVSALRFAAGKNDFSVQPSFSLRALNELHVEFTPKG